MNPPAGIRRTQASVKVIAAASVRWLGRPKASAIHKTPQPNMQVKNVCSSGQVIIPWGPAQIAIHLIAVSEYSANIATNPIIRARRDLLYESDARRLLILG
jgi:hypothetical protein